LRLPRLAIEPTELIAEFKRDNVIFRLEFEANGPWQPEQCWVQRASPVIEFGAAVGAGAFLKKHGPEDATSEALSLS
jgi:hypothetical protein